MAHTMMPPTRDNNSSSGNTFPAIIPAATVLICREGDRGPEVLMIQRHSKSDVHGGSYVFPGGKVDAQDGASDADAVLDQPRAQLQARLHDETFDTTAATAVHVAAAREVFEEAGLLLAEGVTAVARAHVTALAAQGLGFAALLARLGLRLNTRAMPPWSRWVTPEHAIVSPGKRFDTMFFLAREPEGQQADLDQHEAVCSAWLRPREALERYWSGDIVLAPPQIMSMVHLTHYASVDAMFAQARSHVPYVVRPVVFEFDGTRAIAYPGDERHPVRQRVMPGPTRLILRGKRMEPVGGFKDFLRD